MAILKVNVQGGAGFGGYVSVNGGKEFMVVNGGAYDIPTGLVHFDYYTRSSAERKTGRLNAAVNGGSMIGAAMSSANIGESYEINEQVNKNTVVELTAFVKGNRNVYSAPAINTYELSEAEMQMEIDEYNTRLAIVQAEEKAKRKKKFLLYLIILGAFAIIGLILQLFS